MSRSTSSDDRPNADLPHTEEAPSAGLTEAQKVEDRAWAAEQARLSGGMVRWFTSESQPVQTDEHQLFDVALHIGYEFGYQLARTPTGDVTAEEYSVGLERAVGVWTDWVTEDPNVADDVGDPDHTPAGFLRDLREWLARLETEASEQEPNS